MTSPETPRTGPRPVANPPERTPMPDSMTERTFPPEDPFRDDVVPEEALLPADEAPYSERTMPPAEEIPPSASPVTAVPDLERGAQDDESWTHLQGRFVDDPAGAVREAAQLVEDAIAQLAQTLDHLADGDSTEDLRRAFQRYRAVHQALIDV